MTFNDLAKELNLSTATISRALSRPEIVAPQTRTRVLDAVRRSGYQMNGIARSLRTQSTRTIGIIVSDICNPFFSAIVKAVEDVARTNGYTVLICNADEDGRNEEVAMRLFIERQVSGVIRCSAGANSSLLEALRQKSIHLIGSPIRPTKYRHGDIGQCTGRFPWNASFGRTRPQTHRNRFRPATPLQCPRSLGRLSQNAASGARFDPQKLH